MIDKQAEGRQSADHFSLRRNQLLIPDQAGAAWRVESGAIEIFGTRFEGGNPVGHRRHLFTVSSGNTLFGFHPSVEQYSFGILAVASEASEIQQMDTASLSLSEDAQGNQRDIITWSEHVGRYLAGDTPSPRSGTQATRGIAEIPEFESIASLAGHGYCFRLLDGQVTLGGDAHLSIDRSHGWVIWPDHIPVFTDRDPAQIEIQNIESLIADTQLINEAIDGLQDCLVRHLAWQAEGDDARELARREQALALERQQTATALSELTSVLNPRQVFAAGASDLLTVLEVLGQEIGFEVSPPAPSDEVERASHPLEPIARSSRLRWREITLTPGWWRRDSGPLLGFLGEDLRRPVALLPARNSYDVVHADGRREHLDENLRGQLCIDACMIYRPLSRTVTNIFQLLLFTARGQLRDMALIILSGAAATLLGMLVPWTVGVLFDTAIPEADRRMLYEIAALLLVAALAGTVFSFVQAMASLRLGIRREMAAQAATWDRVLQLSPSFFRSYSSGDLQTRVDAVSDINRELGVATLRPLVSGILALLNFGLLWHYSPDLAVIAFWIGIIVMIVTISSSYVIQRLSFRLIEMAGTFHGMVIELIGNVPKLRLTGSEYRAFSHWAARYTPQLKLEMTIDKLADAVALFHIALSPVATGLLFWVATSLVVGLEPGGENKMTMGTFIAFNTAFVLYLSGWSAISNTIVSIIDTMVKAKRVKPILEGELEVGAESVDPGRLSGHIALDNISFRYYDEGPSVLEGVSLEIHPGELVALIGHSGSGKSTLLRLLLGFDRPQQGRILYDGKDLAGLDVIAVRRQIGTVLQNGRLNSGSIYENIANHVRITLSEAWEAAADAGLAGDIEKMPMGIHTVVAEGGTNLSGGQRQRLLIARALATRPKMVFFDEATSALDNRTQSIVTEALDRRRVTRLVIAHRLSTIRNADRLIVLDRGQVAQHGTFAELSKAPGIFRELISRQLV
ncbi:MAG: NHLP bacteriocin export ABC transporter permease/ATPase subunit [Arenicellales bacterium]|jgi:ATP-binding cassette subfamily C protein|nr:NHLP bacteriocin export ABC transporter permease/ATPase subunit [Arenicellales bacterium]MDP6530743.1 NHLP bacteriocin export ABC transporter permease/ATPase subunit [Arenicellales bacterium]MDP6855016.1 NHLP bacteriocin export ABC transporter permease/ATPase subunit [Arenicellales bacterium]|tara:strand:+ start:4702 stop:7608 length:2907 start_codon:yes stop_codon:yes gene_type:complete